MTRYLAFAGWLLCHFVAAVFFGISGLISGGAALLVLLGMAHPDPGPLLAAGLLAAASGYIGWYLLPPVGSRPPLRPDRGYSAADDGPPAPLDPDDPLERLYDQPAYRPPREHRVRPPFPPPPVWEDDHA